MTPALSPFPMAGPTCGHRLPLLSACLLAVACGGTQGWAVDETPRQLAVSVDAATTLRTMAPRRLGGSNLATWIDGGTFASPQVRAWIADLKPVYLRIPGGSWANCLLWNGNGVRRADDSVDPKKLGPDGHPAIDYSGYAPSICIDPKTLAPVTNGWHGNVDVKTLHDFITALPGVESMTCPNLGTGRPVDAAEWVRWANVTNKEKGYGSRLWEIGNELGGAWEPGNFKLDGSPITGDEYSARYVAMAKAMRAVDPTITIGSCTFLKESLRDGGDLVDFVSIHAYPGSRLTPEATMLTDVAVSVRKEVTEVRELIHQYQPKREDSIEVCYSEWNLGGGANYADLFAGLWCSVFLSEMARNGVDFATHWDCFTGGGALISGAEGSRVRRAEYYALWLWNRYQGDRVLPITSTDAGVQTFASQTDEAVTVLLVNGDREREAAVRVNLSGFEPAAVGEMATVSHREYHWDHHADVPLWSTGPRISRLDVAPAFSVTLAPLSMNVLRVPAKAHPALSTMAQEALAAEATAAAKPATAPELRLALPAEVFAGDHISGEVLALTAGTNQPYAKTLPPATLSVSGGADLDRTQVRLAEAVGHFTVTPTAAGTLTITATAGKATVAKAFTVKPSIPRPMVFWDFSTPPAVEGEHFHSEFTLTGDLTQRANRSIARIDLPADGIIPVKNHDMLFKVQRLPGPDRLAKAGIRGVVVDLKTASNFTCADPDAAISVVMQSEANWWMFLGDVPLKDLADWKTIQLPTTKEEHLKAMPAALNILLYVKSKTPMKGSVYVDQVGFLVR